MTEIILFNHLHNGDLFASKGFVNNFCDQVAPCAVNVKYLHINHPKVLSDLPVTYQPIASDPVMHVPNIMQQKMFSVQNKIYINTWVGPYLKYYSLDNTVSDDLFPGINYRSYHYIWNHICNELNKIAPWNLSVSPDIWQSIAEIDREKFAGQWVDMFLNQGNWKYRILVSNGPVHSQQAYTNHNMAELLLPLIQKYIDVQWVFTAPTDLTLPNVIHTNDIIPCEGLRCDLNEIGILSEHCDVIIGRNSGPFLFTNTRKNLENAGKIFLALGKKEEESFPWNMNVPARFYWMQDQNDNQVKSFIETVLHAKYHFT